MTNELSIAHAKARFAEAVRRAERGETIVLTRHGRPVARLEPARPRSEMRAAGNAEVREAPSPYPSSDAAGPPPSAVSPRYRREALRRLLEESIWPRIPPGRLGVRLDKRERERILGYGVDGV